MDVFGRFGFGMDKRQNGCEKLDEEQRYSIIVFRMECYCFQCGFSNREACFVFHGKFVYYSVFEIFV
jgi:hypothetical protein